jgi:hypothetical protein
VVPTVVDAPKVLGMKHDEWTLISHEQQLPHPDAETAVSIVLQQTAVALPSSCVLQILSADALR